MDFKWVYEKLNTLILFSHGVKIQLALHVQMAVLSFFRQDYVGVATTKPPILAPPDVTTILTVILLSGACFL